MDTFRIAACIRAYRREHTMSQTAFGEFFGVSAQAVSKWEREISCPDIALLPALAQILGVSLGYLLGAEA
ncbi:MAG: helix-turn-helix transcriptional regulator [Clostridia bacterium]|nr:helix-turn-helix transcriptional regulator [Clostridia bacterium]